MINGESGFPWALCQLGGTVYGFSCEYIWSIFIYETVTAMPEMAPYLKGILTFRGNVIDIVDLRKYFGMKTVQQEVDEWRNLLEKRKADHIHWLTELERTVRGNSEFTLATDPHKCAFGKWYDSFQTEDNVLKLLLKKFDEPHKRIHGIAETVKQFAENDEYEQALNLIEKTKGNELDTMINLFTQLVQDYRTSRRELVIVLHNDEREFGVTVDNVIAIEPVRVLSEAETGRLLNRHPKGLKVGKRETDETPVLLVDERCFF